MAVPLSIANHHASLPIASIFRRNGTEDCDRQRKVGIPAEVGFQINPEIALEQLRWACATGLPRCRVRIPRMLISGYRPS